MGLRAIVVLSVLPFLLAFILARPFAGILIFVFTTFIRPQNLTWGFEEVRFAWCVSIATLVGYFLQRRSFLPTRGSGAQPWLWAFLAVWLLAAATARYSTDVAFDFFSRAAKVVVFTALLGAMLDRRERIERFLYTFLGGLGALALWAFEQHFRGNERLEGVGNGGDIDHSNALAAAFAMGAPLALAAAWNAKRGWVRAGCLLLAPILVLDVVFTQSRAGYIAIVAATAWAFRFRQLRGRIFAVVAAGSLLVLLALPAAYMDRASTIVEEGAKLERAEDGSVAGRVLMWEGAMAMWAESPVLGVGPENSAFYFKEETVFRAKKSVHNTLLQILADGGIFALAFWIAAHVAGLRDLARARAAALERGDEETWRWAAAIECSLMALYVSAMFNSYNYVEMPYWCLALAGALRHVPAREGVPETSREGKGAPALAAA